jgi:hypothetical protein
MNENLEKLAKLLTRFFHRLVWIENVKLNYFQKGEYEITFHVTGKK